MNALNPVTRVGDQFVDMMQAHERISKKQALAQAGDLLELMCMDRQRVRAYPHELSGGMRQRVIIAMALALEPELIILDEPTTALDVVVQREILQRVQELQRERQFAVLFITHDLSLLIETAHRIAIMYAGSIVETAEASRLGANPLHPYTRGLLASFPPLRGPRQRLTGIGGAPPDLRDPPAGCRFHPRCPECRPDRLGPVRASDDGGTRCCESSSRVTRSPATSRKERRRERARGQEPREALPPRGQAQPAAGSCGRRRLVRAQAGDGHGARR